jgi:hypothetical protein
MKEITDEALATYVNHARQSSFASVNSIIAGKLETIRDMD